MGYHVVGGNSCQWWFLIVVDNHDEALRVAKSLKCADLILDPRVTCPDDAEILVDEITSPRNRGHGGCAATIVLPESQHAFSYACKITRKHGTIMTVSVVYIPPPSSSLIQPLQGWSVNSFDLIF